MEAIAKKWLNSNQLKLIAIIAMTIDHLTWVIWPGYQTGWPQLALHCVGRITAPIMWFFIAEGYHYTHSFKKYALRLLLFAVISHFAYTLIVVLVCLISFCSDWSCIATVAILYIGAYRGSFKKQMTWMMVWVAVYAAVYFFFIDKIYAAVQLFAALSIPLLKSYNGERGSWKGMKWLFYIYYPAHLIACGIIRLLLYGNISIMIGG